MINKAEYEFLKRIKDERWYRDSEIDSNLDFVRRTGYFLSKKGLVEMKEEVSKSFSLTDKGKVIMETISNLEDGTPINKIPKYLIGVLKDLKLIENERYSKKQVDIQNYLKVKGFYKEVENKFYYFKITKQGLIELKNWNDYYYIINIDSLREGKIEIPYLELNIPPARRAKRHIITIWKERVAKIFYELGFRHMEGDYIQPSLWNFDMLFQPQDHPSRELADTFYLDREAEIDINLSKVKEEHEKYWKYEWNERESKKLVLRTHTTVLSAITLYKNKKGKYFSIGRVFRNEATDYKHLAEFHQIEGIIAYPEIDFRDLLGVLEEFYRRVGLDRIKFRPSYFPYTEPSLEIEAYLASKNTWIEVGGAGIFREQVSRMLEAPYPIAAFGLSLERLIMLFEDINDIRELYD